MDLTEIATVVGSVVASAGVAYAGLRKIRNPARARATRFLKAFAQHDIPSNQIADLEHPTPRLTAAQLGDVNVLMDVLAPDHVDWASDLLWIERPWFDGRGDGPHKSHSYRYAQHLPELVEWLQERIDSCPPHTCRLLALSTVARVSDAPAGAVTVVYEEQFVHEGSPSFQRLGRDDKRRYVIIADCWPLDSEKWMVRLAGVFAAAMKAGMLIRGSVVGDDYLLRLQDGRAFIQDRRPVRGEFHGDDLVTGWGYQGAPWYPGFRQSLEHQLKSCNDDELLATMAPVQSPIRTAA